eukprot:TRINITY_DN666_c0_g1_i1.p3 TRINITY_DN666_c0_g1~~TRINITY_DN666_c0_g1_i1.p3  ORF type:complete len:98 (+),score=26.93 TRINITY_DN666_c0_g1_i1:277-570(+)
MLEQLNGSSRQKLMQRNETIEGLRQDLNFKVDIIQERDNTIEKGKAIIMEKDEQKEQLRETIDFMKRGWYASENAHQKQLTEGTQMLNALNKSTREN